jgi:hypothetical protein
MKKRVAAVLIVGITSSASAAEMQQFDLKCSGTANTDASKTVAVPFTRTIHIDLATGFYCNDECSEVRPIFSFDPLRIIFERAPIVSNNSNVDRRTGHYIVSEFNGNTLKWLVGKADCTPAPFTPFPPTKF